jgi:hypothetical protein
MSARERSVPLIESPILTFAEACAYLRRGSSWLKANANRIGVIRDGGKLLFLRSDLDAYLASKRVQTSDVAQLPPTPIRRSAPVKHRHALNPVSGRPWPDAPVARRSAR